MKAPLYICIQYTFFFQALLIYCHFYQLVRIFYIKKMLAKKTNNLVILVLEQPEIRSNCLLIKFVIMSFFKPNINDTFFSHSSKIREDVYVFVWSYSSIIFNTSSFNLINSDKKAHKAFNVMKKKTEIPTYLMLL